MVSLLITPYRYTNIKMIVFPKRPEDYEHYFSQVHTVITQMKNRLNCHSNSNLKDLLLCHRCQKPSLTIDDSPVMEHSNFITLTCNCSSVESKWCLCVRCDHDNQPKPVSCYKFRTKAGNDELIKSLCDHRCVASCHQSCQTQLSRCDDDNTELLTTPSNDDSVNFDNMMVREEIEKCFPALTKFDESVRMFIMDCPSYEPKGMYFVRRHWLKTSFCQISLRDCIIFLRLMKTYNFGSRNSNIWMTKTIAMIEGRSQSELKEAHTRIVDLELGISQILQVIGIQQQALLDCGFGIMVSKINEIGGKVLDNLTSSEICSIPIVKVKLPSSDKEIRSATEGKNSFLHNLMKPTIHTLNCGYSYVLPSECLRFSFAFGEEVEMYRYSEIGTTTIPQRSIFRSPEVKHKIQELNSRYDESCYYVPVGLWSDGCDVGGLSKANRSMIKLTTMHIHSKCGPKHIVFPIAIGKSKSDHNSVRKIFMEDLKNLEDKRCQCYVPSIKKAVDVIFFLGYITVDRVEHAELTSFSSHNGVYSTIPGYSFPLRIGNVQFVDVDMEDHESIEKPLSSCSQCRTKRQMHYDSGNFEEAELSVNNCTLCNDWDYKSVRFRPHKHYPTDLEAYRHPFITAKKVTFDSMKTAYSVIFEKIRMGTWSIVKAKKYAQVECLSSKVVNSIIEFARSVGSVNELSDDDNNRFWEMIPHMVASPSLSLDQCMVGSMHTIVLNLGKHVLLTICECLKKSRQFSLFYSKMSDFMESVQRMSLSWCKAWSLGSKDKPGGPWVSENYLSFAMLSKSVISVLFLDTFKSHDFHKPLLRMIWSYNVLLSCAMSGEESNQIDIKRLGSVAKIFLSDFQTVEDSQSSTEKSKIETAACLLNVLTLKESIEKYGILRNYWEGGSCGEGYFLLVKPLFKRGTHSRGCLKAVHTKLYNDRMLTLLLDEISSCETDSQSLCSVINLENDTPAKLMQERYRKFHSYSDKEYVNECVSNSLPIAIMYQSTTNSFWISCGHGSVKSLYRVMFRNVMMYLNTICFKIDVTDEVQQSQCFLTVHNNMTSALALPIHVIRENSDENQEADDNVDVFSIMYYIHTEEHKEYRNGNVFEFPRLPSIATLETILQHKEDLLRSRLEDNSDERDQNNDDIWSNREYCSRIVGSSLRVPDDETLKAVVGGFRHVNRIRNKENCRWSIRYYNNDDETMRRAKSRKDYCAQDMIQILDFNNINFDSLDES